MNLTIDVSTDADDYEPIVFVESWCDMCNNASYALQYGFCESCVTEHITNVLQRMLNILN